MPAVYAVRLLGEASDAGATHASTISLVAGDHAPNGALLVTADTPADAARVALSGQVEVTYFDQSAIYSYTPDALTTDPNAHDRPYLMTQPDAVHQPNLWRIGLEDLQAANLQSLGTGVDWDYNDRTWDVSVRDYQPPIIGTGTGLLARYYNTQDFADLGLIRVDAQVNTDWGTGSPDEAIGTDHFSARWTGQVQPAFSGNYTFKTLSDDGVRLWVNDQLLIDNWTDHGPTTDASVPIPLVAGQKYDLRMEYYENGGGATARLLWSSEDQPEEAIPTSQLYPEMLPAPVVGTGMGLLGQYFDEQNLSHRVLSRVDAQVSFDWGGGSPDGAVPADHFSTRWTGQVQPEYSGVYTFYTRSDDGVRLWVNDQLLIDNWTDHGPTEDRGTIAFAAGQMYTIRMEYYENSGGATAQLLWSSDNQVKQIIPTSQLYPAADAVDDSYSIGFGQTLSIPASDGVLRNDLANGGPALTAIAASGATAHGGSYTLQADGSFTYTPPTGYAGADSFTYTATNGTTTSSPATVNIDVVSIVSVAAVNDAVEDGTAGTFRFTRIGDLSQPLTVYYTVGGTATPGTDYTALSGYVTFAAYAPTADVTVSAIGDSEDEPLEWVTVDIDTGPGYAVGDPGSALLDILDSDLPVVTVRSVVDAAEGGANGLFRVYRTLGSFDAFLDTTPDLSSDLTVSYTVSGSATPGDDYATLSGTVTIPAGELYADISIIPVDDGITDPDETVTLTLGPGTGYTVGSSGTDTVTIAEEAAGAVSGQMWEDTDGDGVQDGGESGYGQSVFLMHGGEVVAETTTDASGDYSFAGVKAGIYDVLFDIPGGFTPTTSANGVHTITVVAGATTAAVDEGVKPPASPPAATGNRDGIQWGTLDLSSKTTITFANVVGKEYTVKTLAGHTVQVFEANPAATQIGLRSGLDIRYNCHGFSINTTGVVLADGSIHDFAVISNASALQIFNDQYDTYAASGTGEVAGVTAAKTALAAGKRVILVFFSATGDPVHSMRMTSIVTKPDGTLDWKLSKGDSKNGWFPLTLGDTARAVDDRYVQNGGAEARKIRAEKLKSGASPADAQAAYDAAIGANVPIDYEFRVLK